MSTVTIIDQYTGYFCFGCNTSDTAFGPLMWLDPRKHDIEQILAEFTRSLERDPRALSQEQLKTAWNDFKWSNLL